MSADNYIGVFKVGEKWGVCMGFMSDERDNPFADYDGPLYNSRADALVAAHDEYRQSDIIEYGVIELDNLKEM